MRGPAKGRYGNLYTSWISLLGRVYALKDTRRGIQV
jgi:hypothetical protein